ncbi:MAG: chemotaxis protein CheD [Bacteroidales bacterium]|nr:chemotaxis protein CheD [Bacteroidales bacterium]
MNNSLSKYIYSSGLYVSDKEIILNTVLGSCVSVCLWDNMKKVGGMNHYMLPLWNGNGLASPKYGNIAIEQLITKVHSFGCKNENIVAKIFGGARMLKEQSQIFDIGRKNIELAYELLARENIRIIAKSTGGERGRKISFNTGSGEVLQKLL